MRKIDKLKNIQRANMLSEQRYLMSKGLSTENDQQLIGVIKEQSNENLFDKVKDFFLKTFQKGEYRYKAIDLLLKSIDRNELHNEIDLDKKFKEKFDLYTVNNQKLNDILYPHLGRTERLKKLSDGQFKIVMSRIKEVISMIESSSKSLKQQDTEKDERKKQEEERKKQEEERKKQEEERSDKQKTLRELLGGISNKVKYADYYDTLKPFYWLLRISSGKGSGKESGNDSIDDLLKEIYQISNKNVNQEIDTSSILNEVNSLNKSFEDYVSLYKEIYNKTPDEQIKEKKETDDEINQILQTIKQYKSYKEMVLDVLNKNNRLVNHKGKIVYHGSERRDLEKDKFNNTINTKKRTGYGLYTSPQLNTAARYAFAYIFGHLSKGGVDLKANYGGKVNVYRIELGNMPFLLRFDPNIDKEELEVLLAFGIGGYDGLFQTANEIEISIITSDNISKAERITNSNYPAEFKEIKEFGKNYMGRHDYGKSDIDKEKFITARLEERLNSLLEERKQHNKINNQLIESILSSNNLNENENFDKLKDKLKQAAKAGILTTVIITKLLGPAYGLNPDQKSEIKDIAKKANIELSADDQITPDIDGDNPYKTIIKTLEKDGKIKSVNKPFGQFNDDTQFKTFSAVGQTEAAAKSAAMQTAIINGASTTDLQMSGQITIELTNGNIKVVYLIHKEKPQPKNLDDKQNLGDKIKSQTQKIGGDIKSTTSKVTGDIKNIFKK